MKSATYEITGCAGSQSYRMTGEFDTISAAKRAARATNGRVADGRGETLREYARISDCGEGWTVAGKLGFDGHKTGR